MAKKTLKKITCTALAFASVFACAATATACETARPQVEMKIEFNGETYTLEYELYRKIAPTTVSHFIWLADNGYYDGLCVHNYDYTANKMYTGGYTVSSDNDEGIAYKPYFEEIKKFDNFADFPVSVWMNADKTNPTYTLYGEFSSNNFRVENGAQKQSFGSLTMYYTSKSTDEKVYASYLNEGKKGKVASRQYKYNSATSLFYISLSESTVSTAGYCTFATLKEDSVDVLKDFQADLNAFIEKEYGKAEEETSAKDFVTSKIVTIHEDDPIVGETTETYKVPNSPIVIKTVKVKKY